MFSTPIPKSILTHSRDILWPRNGWQRAGQYLWHRLHRLPGSPYSIAAGLASGSALSVTPFIGVHFFLAALLAWIIRGNVVASAFGTVIGNPWTFPVIWLSTYQFGRFILGHGFSSAEDLDFTSMFTGLVRSMIEADGNMFAEQVWPIWMPMLVGSVPSALVTWVVVYMVCFRVTASYQAKRKARREAKARRQADADRKQDAMA